MGVSGGGSQMWPVWGGCEASGPVNTGAFIPSLLFSGVQDGSSGPRGGAPRPAPSAEARAPSTAPTVGASPAARMLLLSGEKKPKQKTLIWCLSCLSLL